MVSFPNGKINVGLSIISKREDGYHNIESCFYPVPWTDILEIIEAKKTKITMSGIPIPGNPDENLCLKAYKLLKKDFQLPEVHIHLHKNIPIGAGLGGGSSDASFVLKLLNDLYNLFLNSSVLEQYASSLGSDCPFFIENKPVIAKETGHAFEPATVPLAGKHISIVYPSIHVPTAKAYSGVQPRHPEIGVKEIVEKYPLIDWKTILKNDFEDSIFLQFPEILAVKKLLYRKGAVYASMSGSGSSVYGISDEKLDLKGVFDASCLVWQGTL